MPCPFPGMDPYLESSSFWRGFHHMFITYALETLQPRLIPTYRADVEEREYVEGPDRSIYPDLSVSQMPPPMVRDALPAYVLPSDRKLPLVVACDEPEVGDEPVREGFIEIRRPRQGDLVTLVELLSPTNKRPADAGRTLYLRKQMETVNSNVHLVEIDLLRLGEHTLAVPRDLLSKAEPFDYLACVVRQPERHRFELYPTTLAEPMPDLKIPLLPEDDDVRLPMQEVFSRVYEVAAYDLEIDYDRDPLPPFTPEQREWARQLTKPHDDG